MTSLRALLVAATIAGSIAGSLAALVADRVVWPFSNYPMYSTLSGPTTAFSRAVGVAGDTLELPLPPDLEPSGLLLEIAVDRARAASDSAARLTRIATAMWAEYQRRRAAGSVNGPALTAVRIYRETVRLSETPHRRTAVRIAQGPRP